MQAVEIEDPIDVIVDNDVAMVMDAVIGNDVNMEVVIATQTLISTEGPVGLISLDDSGQDRDNFAFNASIGEETAPVERIMDEFAHQQQSYDTLISRRVKDCLKKRRLRENNDYRMRESESAKQRMANKRTNPAYRELERQKDKERRAEARKSSTIREKEKKRDRQYKRRYRKDNMNKDSGKYASCDGVNDCAGGDVVVETVDKISDLKENTFIDGMLTDCNVVEAVERLTDSDLKEKSFVGDKLTDCNLT